MFSKNIIEINDLSTRLGGRWIHRHLNLEMQRGTILALIGGSGTGKTVLLRHIIGLLHPVSGSISVFGRRNDQLTMDDLRKRGRRWGVLFQQGALFSAFTVFENIAFPLREMRKDGQDVDEKTLRELVFLKIEMVGLSVDDAWKYPSELSGGMLKRAALARALALDVELLFLDEPSSGLDPISAAEFDQLLLELRQELNLSVFMVSHDLTSIAALSDQIAILGEGRVLTTGSLEEVVHFDHPFIKEYFKSRPGQGRLHKVLKI